MKIGNIGAVLVIGVLLTTSAGAELRHVEITTLGMD